MDWTSNITEEMPDLENLHFQSFRSFAEFPTNVFGLDIIVEAKMLVRTDPFRDRAKDYLTNLSQFSFSDVAGCGLVSLALRDDVSLLTLVPNESPIIPLVWCLANCVEDHVDTVMRIWHERLFHPPPVRDRVDCQAVLLLLEFCMTRLEPTQIPPFTSDEYETVFALAYCSKQTGVSKLASFILPQLTPFIVDSQAAHLLFRRMLPYCAMENKHGRKVALQVIEEIVGHHMRFPSTISTWITMHPFCVAASNNLLVDMQSKGLITSQMKNLIRQLEKMNKRLLKGKIRLSDDVKRALPRSLWRVEFPPPRQEVMVCSDTCKKMYKSIESKQSILVPVILLFAVIYVIYVLI